MKVLCVEETDPYRNLAMEEVLLRTCTDDDYLILWRNTSSVIVGRYQNTAEEIDQTYIREHSIPVVRRMTGGGCVFHDLGNLNYSFLTDARDPETLTIEQFTRPVCAALRKLGVPAEVTGRNDILAGEKKISGCAQVIINDRLLHHGTLLFSAGLDDAALALRAAPEKFTSKSTKSVRSRIGNILSYLKPNAEMDVLAFRDYLIKELGKHGEVIRLDQGQLDAIEQLSIEKYRTWDWNYGESPKFQFRDRRKFSAGIVDVGLSVEDGKITAIQFQGDVLARKNLGEIEAALCGCIYRQADVTGILRRFPMEDYFGELSPAVLADFIVGIKH